jgi:hypothetical protein
MINEENKYEVEKALKAFWLEHGKAISVNAKHTCVNVEPKFIIGNRINPEIAKKIIGVYLSQITSDKVVSEQVIIDGDGVKIFDEGKVVLEMVNQRMVDSISNKVTSQLGKELAKKEKKSGGKYIESSEKESFTFGEIRQALSDFLMDSEKHDSKNMLRDAVLLLVK